MPFLQEDLVIKVPVNSRWVAVRHYMERDEPRAQSVALALSEAVGKFYREFGREPKWRKTKVLYSQEGGTLNCAILEEVNDV